MASPTEIYVNPAIAADSGTGTSGDPYGDLQYALNTATRDSTNGDRFNIKAGTAEVLTGILDLTTYGTPTADAPLIIEGYTSAAGDGGIGDLNGNGGNFQIVPNNNFQIYRNMKLRNTGTAAIVQTALNWATYENCEFSSSTSSAPLNPGSGTRVINCSFHTFATAGQAVLTIAGAGTIVTGCWFDVGDILAAINMGAADTGLVTRNIVNCSGGTVGIRVNNVRGSVISHNSILGSSSTGSGIGLVSSGADGCHVFNNIIAGFSGAGGDGIDIASGSRLGLYGYNYFYNNTSDETGVSGNVLDSIGGNLLAQGTDPYAKSGANTFANRFIYFEPSATSSGLRGGAYGGGGRLDIGAVQTLFPTDAEIAEAVWDYSTRTLTA